MLDGETASVRVGALVFVHLVEPGRFVSGAFPRGFPWTAPASSDVAILRPVALCASRLVSTLPVRVYGYRAVRAGTAQITAVLAPRWAALRASRRRGLRPFRAIVTVKGSFDQAVEGL